MLRVKFLFSIYTFKCTKVHLHLLGEMLLQALISVVFFSAAAGSVGLVHREEPV